MGISSQLVAQNWEEEIGFLYTKGEYLMQTNRYDEAVKQLSLVINKNQSYKDALYLRALSKYNLRSYKGVKKDLLLAMDIKGLEGNLVELMGLTEYELGEYDKALKNLGIAEVLSPDNHDVKVVLGQIYQKQGKYSQACHKWSDAFKYGSRKARSLMVKHCDAGVGNATEDDIAYEDEEKDYFGGDRTEKVDSAIRVNTGTRDYTYDEELDEPSSNEEAEPSYEEDNEGGIIEDTDVNEIEIDEDLSLSLYGNGLGNRKILDQPSILILSDISGKVTIKVCVNKGGRIESAVLDEERSTIDKQSLISLALRKSKQFWFAKSNKEQCGLIVFNIKGS